AFAAGGLALSVPLAAGVFRHRVTGRQVLAVLLIAGGLAALPVGFSTTADHLAAGRLIATVAVGAVAGAILWRVPTPSALAAAAGTFAGFLCFQAALDTGDAVPGISLMTAGTALVALACGLGAFGESLGAGAAASVMHGLAIAVVLAAVPSLAAAHGDRRSR